MPGGEPLERDERLEQGQGGESDAPRLAPGPTERSSYAPPPGRHMAALVGMGMIYALGLAALLLLGVSRTVPVKAPSALTVVNLLPEASPPEAPPEEKEAPKPTPKQERPEPPRVEPIEPLVVPIAPVAIPLPVTAPRPSDPVTREAEKAAPQTIPAAPAPQMAGNAPDSWEARILARLNSRRRYPGGSIARREQGIPYIRFVMDRDGKVLSSRLERSSGFPDLDREAVTLPKRASPLPKPPDDKPGDTLEMVVPVEFFLS